MIVYLVTADHAYTLNRYLKEWAPSLSNKIQTIFYEEKPWDWLELEATYVFSDIERLTPTEMLKAIAYAEHLSSLGFRVLNHPSQAPVRLALQSILHEAGINPFRMFPVAELDKPVFPVFLRLANSHQGSIGDLIYSRDELDRRLASLDGKIAHAEDLVVAEYCDTRDSAGRYTKFSVMRVGDAFVPRHAFSSEHWMLKSADIVDEESITKEHEFLHRFPQRVAVEEIFTLAKIDFGRIDFGMQNDEIRVWEINTNPTFMPAKKGLHPLRAGLIGQTNEWLIDALIALDGDISGSSQWQEIANRHERKRKVWWWQRKLFRRKRP